MVIAPAIKQSDVFIYSTPEILDLSSKSGGQLSISGGGNKLILPVSNKLDKLYEIIKIIGEHVNPPGAEKTQSVLGWNIKSFFSYFFANTGKFVDLKTRVCDLKVLEAFCGLIGRACPTNFGEAMSRMAEIAVLPNWGQLQDYYKKVAYPLLSTVLPVLEATPLVHTELKKYLYAHYEIEGQVNGRLNCGAVFKNSYNPHTLSEDVKEKLNPPTNEAVDFVYFDYNHMEVSVLQWLSQDENLGELLTSGQDLYEGIWEKLTNIKCTPEYRKICKRIFLPVVYGQGAASLSNKLEIPTKTAVALIDRSYKAFPKALHWVKSQVIEPNNFATDYFGRRRQFNGVDDYRVRNFVIQAPAATICLHKLIKLYEAIKDSDSKIVFHVHDGYGLIMNQKNKNIQALREVLEAEEDYYSGIKLKVSCSVGTKLNKLKKII